MPAAEFPYNLINDLLDGRCFNKELDDCEAQKIVEDMIEDISDRYTRNKNIPARLQNVMLYHYVNGLTLQQVGEIMGISRTRVWQMKNRALRIMSKSELFSRLYTDIDN